MLVIWCMRFDYAVQEILCSTSSPATLGQANRPCECVCRERDGWACIANPWAHAFGWHCPCLFGVQQYQCPSILLPEPAAYSAILTDVKEATHMLKISPGAGPDFSAHYGTELLTDDINSLACETFVHTLSRAAGPRSWPHVLAEEPMVLFTGTKMSGSSVRSVLMPMPVKPSCPILPGYL